METQLLQKGVISIEFALSFVILLAFFYGIVGYTMPLLLSASYQQLSSDSLREGIAWQRHRFASDADAQNYVEELIAASWVPAEWAQYCDGRSQFLTIDAESGIWEVCLRHSAPNTILPPINLMGWEFPQLPSQIVGFAAMHTRECKSLNDETCTLLINEL